MFNFIRGQDLFATPVQISYKGSRAFRTILGGMCSILFIAVVTIFFVVDVHELIVDPTFRETQTHTYLVESDEPDYIIPTSTNSAAG